MISNRSKPVTAVGAFLPIPLLQLHMATALYNSHSNTTTKRAQRQKISWRDGFRAVLQAYLLRARRFKFLDGWPSWGQGKLRDYGGWELCTSLCLHR